MNLRLVVVACLGLSSMALPASADPAPATSPVVLVASGNGVESFGETVVLAMPLKNGGHFGFVLNIPTEKTVADLFPDEDASRHLTARVDIGGSAFTSALFALVVDPATDIEGLRRVSPQFSVALGSDEVDSVIARQPDKTRYFLGLLAWSPDSLEQQVKAGAWTVLMPDARIVLSAQPATLWRRLSQGSALRNAMLTIDTIVE